MDKGRILSCEALPTLPAVAMELLEKTSNPDVAINEIAHLIQSDPGLAGKVLKTVNSSFYGLPKPCPSIDRAIGMLGLRAVKSLVLGFSMVNLTQGVDDGFDMTMFWRRTIIAAAGARQVALASKTCEPDEAFAAGLFQDMGMLAIFVAAPQKYLPLVSRAGVFHNSLYKAELKQFGFSHATIGAELAQRWQMPGQIVEAIRHHHTPEEAVEHSEIVRVVALGALAARCVIEDVEGLAYSELLEKANAWYGWHQQDLTRLLEQTTTASKGVARLLGQGIGEMPDPQQLLVAANQRLVEQQIIVQRESEGFKKQAEEFEQAATTDGLTGIANRKRFDEVAEEAMATATRTGQPIAVLFSDADKFKFVNDTYGHHAGDLVLIELARRLVQTVGEKGTVCRYGGEEFAIVMPGASLEAASQMGEAMRCAIAQGPFDLAEVPNCPDTLPRTVSVGVAAWIPGQPQVSAQELVQQADKAVYFAKESGRNNVKRWGVDLGDEIAQPMPGDEPAQAAVPAAAALATHNDADPFAGEIVPDLSPVGQTIRVLIVDDDALAAHLMKTMFERLGGVEITVARDGRSAVEFLRDAQRPSNSLPDLIVCDVNMPGFTGLQIVKALKANPVFKHIPVAMVTAVDDSQMLVACREAGATDVYDKATISVDLDAWCRSIVAVLTPAA
ncbi:MAG: HDOD domain-containing protein [Planctomycetota bacterium]